MNRCRSGGPFTPIYFFLSSIFFLSCFLFLFSSHLHHFRLFFFSVVVHLFSALRQFCICGFYHFFIIFFSLISFIILSSFFFFFIILSLYLFLIIFFLSLLSLSRVFVLYGLHIYLFYQPYDHFSYNTGPLVFFNCSFIF